MSPVCSLPFKKKMNQLEKVRRRAKTFFIYNKEYMIYREGCRWKDSGIQEKFLNCKHSKIRNGSCPKNPGIS